MFSKYYTNICFIMIFSGMGISFYYHAKIELKIKRLINKNIGLLNIHKLLAERKKMIDTVPKLKTYQKMFYSGIVLIIFGFILQIIFWIFTSI